MAEPTINPATDPAPAPILDELHGTIVDACAQITMLTEVMLDKAIDGSFQDSYACTNLIRAMGLRIDQLATAIHSAVEPDSMADSVESINDVVYGRGRMGA